MDLRSCPSPDQIECVIEDTCSVQSFKIFIHCFDASRKSDY